MSHKKRIHKSGIVIFWILVWQVAAMAVNNAILLVPPWEAFLRLLELIRQPVFGQAVLGSFIRIGGGFFLGLSVALILTGISWRYSLVEELLQPVMTLLKTVPVASFVVLLLIWWGSSLLAVAICFLVVLPQFYINMLEGLKATDNRLLEMARVFHMPVGRQFIYLYRPSMRPFLKSAMKISLGMCWKSGIAAEVIGMPMYSIGEQLYLSKIHLDTAGVLAWTACIILISLGFEKLVMHLTNGFFAWNPSPEKVDAKIKPERCEKITISQLCKSYGKMCVIDNMSAEYEQGKIYYVTGPSGSGKTTLFRLLCGLEHSDSGRIEGNCRYSMVFQEDRLCEDYSAVWNVFMITGDWDGARRALAKLLPKEALDKPCKQLSGGMKRRVALVRAMEAESDAVLLDEPFTGMDKDTKAAAEAYIDNRQKGRILIVATHMISSN